MFVSTNTNSKRNQSLVSNEVCEALGKSTLTRLESEDKKCIGLVILKVKIKSQPMYCTFYVVNLSEIDKDATLGWYWMY